MSRTPPSMAGPRFRRVLLKLSGEALAGDGSHGIDYSVVGRIAGDVAEAQSSGVQVCLVIGGGNIVRGVAAANAGMERSSADYMGMLATVINALAMQNALEQSGVDTRVLSAIPMSTVCEPYIHRRGLRHLEKGRVVIFAGGTGHPFFTTDSAASLRAAEMSCDALLKGTQVDGVYDSDPRTNPAAKRYDILDYKQVLSDDLKVMDASAVSLARENGIPILVFSIHKPGALAGVLKGQGTWTTITEAQESGDRLQS
jgi:uridylate kinase